MSRKRFHRTRWTALGAGFVLLLTLVVAPARSRGEFVLGSGDTKAEFLKVGPTTASLNAGLIVGQVLSDFQNGVARAQSRAVDMTIYGTSLTAVPCDGGDPSLHKENLPTTLRVDSRQEGSSDGQTAYWPILPRDLPYQFDDTKEENGGFPNLDPGDDSPFRIDTTRLYVEASETPHAFAAADTAVTRVGGVADVVGGRVETTAEIVDQRRVATSVVEIPRITLGDGQVVLRDLRWEARQTTGPDAPADFEMSGGFSLGSVQVGDAVYAWPDDAQSDANEQTAKLLDVVNAALLPGGLRVEWPALDQERQHVTVSPLTVIVDRPPLGAALFDFVPKEVYDARKELVDALIAADCQMASFITLGDIFLAVPAGAGHLEVSFGGARAFTEGTQFADPFATGGGGSGGTDFELPPGFAASGTEGPARVAGAQTSPPGASGDVLYGEMTPPVNRTDGPVAVTPILDVGGSKSGTAAVVGLFGLLAVLGVALLDYLRPRRVLAGLASTGEDEAGE